MKAAVITLHTVANYGTQLQAFATQEKLKQFFDEVVFIDYRRQDTYGRGLLKTYTKGNALKAPIILPTLLYWKRVFGGFRKKYLNLTEETYLTESDLNAFIDCADVYFSGSDQVWNTGWNHGVLPAMYLSFVPKGKPKYAFSSSFGMQKISGEDVDKSIQFIREYKQISVRENSGVRILKEQYHYDNAVCLIDPTLAFSGDFWRKYGGERKIKEPYILIYNLKRNSMLDAYAKNLANRTGLKLYRFCTRFDQVVRKGKSLLIPDIFEFISLIDYATYVVTDSFHATAFSVNLHTEPICIYPKNYSCRLAEFLKSVGLEDRHVVDFNDFSMIEKHIDFVKVDQSLEKERAKVDKFLEGIVRREANEI